MKSLPTIVQTTKNNIDLGSPDYLDRFKLFFDQLEYILGMDLGSIMAATSTTAQLADQDLSTLRNLTDVATIASGILKYHF